MPNNRVIYLGVVLVVVTVLLWVGAELARRVEWILPYVGAVGVILIVTGAVYELYRSRKAR